MQDWYEKVGEAEDFLSSRLSSIPQIAIILGSGLGALADEIQPEVTFPYDEIPNFPPITVEGHSGIMVIGELENKQILAMQGRPHYYEGRDMQEITFPTRVMAKLGIKDLIVTNASGGINESFEVGDLMIITDHINLMGTNPLIGPNYSKMGPRFPNMTQTYDKELIELSLKVAEEEGIKVQKGVYVGVSGPSYETPAEIRFLRIIGADAVGMSTVPEVIVARHCSLRVLGISCITGVTREDSHKTLSHQEVIEVAETSGAKFKKLIRGIIRRWK